MYGIFTYTWLRFMVNEAKYTIHGAYGLANINEQMLHQFLEDDLCWEKDTKVVLRPFLQQRTSHQSSYQKYS